MTPFSFAGFVRQSKLAIAAAAIGASLFAASAQAEFVDRNGVWDTFSDDGSAGVMTTFDDGSVLSLAAINGQLHLLLKEPSWNLRVGRKVSLDIVVDGNSRFVGKAEAVSSDTLDIVVNNASFLRAFVHGDEATVKAFSETWNVSLYGSARATIKMVQAMDQ